MSIAEREPQPAEHAERSGVARPPHRRVRLSLRRLVEAGDLGLRLVERGPLFEVEPFEVEPLDLLERRV